MELTTRLIKIKKRLLEKEFFTKKEWYFENDTILKDQTISREPLVVRKALAIDYVASNLPVYIKEDELIIGNPNQCSVEFGLTFPEYSTQEEQEKAKKYALDEKSIWGHHPPRWDSVVKKGISAIKQQILDRLTKEINGINPRKDTLDIYRAMIISLDAIIKFARRHAEYVLAASLNETDQIRKRELLQIYETCSRVPEFPARTYQEALQSYWFTYCILSSSMEFIPLGRTDQLLYPFFYNDLSERRITKEYAIDLTGSFLAKCNERIQMNMLDWEKHYPAGIFSQGFIPENGKGQSKSNWWLDQRLKIWRSEEDINSDSNYNYGQSGNDWLMNMVVGGLTKDGKDGTNELSSLIIELVQKMELVMPTLAVRVHRDMPEEFYYKIAESLRFGQGEPVIYNDDQIIEGFIDLGVPIEDANDYTNDGCWEVLIPGKSYFSYAHIENLQCLEWVLTRGESLTRNRIKEGLDTGDPCGAKTWEEFYQKYQQQVNSRIDFEANRRLNNFGLSSIIAPDPLISALMDDCIEDGTEFTSSGARYNFHCILFTGFSHVVDSLSSIKKFVFEEKSVPMSHFVDAVRKNWQGYEDLRNKVINRAPKFGNDDAYADEIAVKLLSDFEKRVDYWNRKQRKILFPCGIGTFENYALLGRRIGASVDGRYEMEPLGPNYSPTPGFDQNGPTAVFKSITKPNLLKYYCGCPLDISVNYNEFEGEAGLDRMAGLIKSFCDLGGNILTITSCSEKILREAQKNPEKYKTLRVRLGGLSAYFICLSPAQQENIIKRFSNKR